MRTNTRLTLLALLLVLAHPVLARAQQSGTLRLTVVDPSDAVIVGAHVTVTPASATSTPFALESGARGDAVFVSLAPGRYQVHVEASGFEPSTTRDVRVRAGENSRTIKLAIAGIAETVTVGRDARERGSDPRSDAFSTVLGPQQIKDLPDDPDAAEQVLRDMAGPGAVLRVNGFRGGRLPPKDQIAQIRFRRNMFAADAHEPGFISVDVITKPGLDNWRASSTLGFRNDVLSARNAFAPSKGDERNERLGFSLNGPLRKGRTSLSLSIDGTNAFDSRTIRATLPSGYFADSIRRPNDTLNLSTRVEHALTATQLFRVEAQRNHAFNENLGVGDFDLSDRAYHQSRNESVLRASIAGGLRKSLYHELKVQWRSQEVTYGSLSQSPALIVQGAFNAGGAQIDGTQSAQEIMVADDLDIAAGRHAIRAGLLLEGGWYNTDVRRNTGGTFTFADLTAYQAGEPTTFTQTIGDPHVSVSQLQSALYVQDDFRASASLTLSGGIRQEYQSPIGGLQLGPRGGVAWSPFKSGKTTIRAGGGVFFDWFDAQTYEQTIQLDGTHEQLQTFVQPGYPAPSEGARPLLLPDGRVQLGANLTQPTLHQASVGIERQVSPAVRLNATVIHRSGSHLLRGINVNAPLPTGARPDPSAGAITDIQSSASSTYDALNISLNVLRPERRLFMAASYTLSRSIDETDSPLSVAANAYDLAAERGPALSDARHRAMGFINAPLFGKLTIGGSFRVQSALPYNITTGRDDNNDTISNDRPAGVTRNTGRGSALFDVSARVSWRTGFGGPRTAAPGGPVVRIATPDTNLLDGPADNTQRFGLEFYAQVFNALNHLNALNFSGVTSSPLFGQATSAAASRRVEIGTRATF